MKKISFLNFVLFLCLLFIVSFSGAAFADPINDGVFNVKNAGWFKSSATPCNEVCKRQGADAENEMGTYLCKIPSGQQLYGNNFSSNSALKKLCLSVTPNMKPVKSRRFMCLCVR